MINSLESEKIYNYKDNFITNINTIKKQNISHIFYQLCYNIYYQKELMTNNVKNIFKNAKIYYYNYGYSMVDHKFLGGVGENSNFFGHCDCFFLENELNMEHYRERINKSLEKSNICNNIKFKAIGCVKLDLYNKLERMKHPDGYFYIMWCPRWHISKGMLNMCCYNLYVNYFISLINNNKKIKLLFRPHPKLNYSIELIEKASKENPRIIIDRSVNYFNHFKYIDVFISDPSSLLGEALNFLIPIIYTKRHDNVFTKFGNLIQDSFYHVTNTNNLDNTIKKLFNNEDEKKK